MQEKAIPAEGVKLSGSLDAGKNCKWIVSLETPVRSGAEGANNMDDHITADKWLYDPCLESLRQKDRGCFIIPADSYERYEQYFLNFLIFETVCYYFVSQLYNILHFLKEKGDLLLCGKRSIHFYLL